MLTEDAIEEFTAQTHVLLGIPTCAECGRPQASSTALCFCCLEKALQDDQPLLPRLTGRSDFYHRLTQVGQPNPAAQARIVRYSQRKSAKAS